MRKRAMAQAAPRRRQADRRALSGRRLVQAAIEVVAERGMGAATFEAIGVRSGYSRSLVTQRFGDKRGLIDAVIRRSAERFEGLPQQRKVAEASGFDALLMVFDLYLTQLTSSRVLKAYFRLLASAVAESTDARPLFAAEHEDVRRQLARIVARGQAEGGIRPEIDAGAAALVIGSLQLGLSIQMLVDPAMDLDPIRRTALDTLARGFAVPATTAPRSLGDDPPVDPAAKN